MEKKLEVEAQLFQFGPLICKYQLDKNFILSLNERGENSKIDHKSMLAGHINNEFLYSKEDQEWFMKEIDYVFFDYIQKLKKISLNPKFNIKSVMLRSLWINFMKNGEYNPPHDHTGNISFVIYTSVPKEIINENLKFEGKGAGPGCITFLYGEKSIMYKTIFSFIPKEGDMFLFPASLRHFVAPFKSDVKRVSISGNIDLE